MSEGNQDEVQDVRIDFIYEGLRIAVNCLDHFL